MNDTLHQLATQTVALFSQAVALANAEVDDIIQSGDGDTRRIEHQLDHMLGFCCDPDVLVAYKRLCRHYFAIDPQATADYVYAYRDMWDEENAAPQVEEIDSGCGAGCADTAKAGGLGYEF